MKRVLLVEDEVWLREALATLMRENDMDVVETSNGTEALQVLKTTVIDILISDVRMAGGDGIILLRQVCEFQSQKPRIFICTGYSDLDSKDLDRLGVERIFYKPFAIQDLLDCLL